MAGMTDQNPNPETLVEDSLARHPRSALDRPFWMQLTEGRLDESEQAWPGFKQSLRTCALAVVADDEPDRVRRALQCHAFVGNVEDIPQLQKLLTHPAAEIASDTRTCIFQIEHRTAR
jgi:hypothetical protein